MVEANILVPIAMFGCIAVFLALFYFLPARQAVLASYLGAWLFLPEMTYQMDGLPDYTKLFATSFGIMLAVFIFDFRRLLTFRPKWVDIPMIIWLIVPVGASLTNELPVNSRLYDGLSESLAQVILWGFPYFLGRIYFTKWTEIKELALGIIISGLVYSPLILLEMWQSPQLHRWVYGYHQHLFGQTQRFGFWRPMVFMEHGLMVAFWIMSVAVLSIWMWQSGTIKQLEFKRLNVAIPMKYVAAFFGMLTVMMVSVNAWLWLSTGLTVLFLSKRFNTRWITILFLLAIPTYVTLQASGVWPSELTVDFATGLLGAERAQSLEYRYFNEEFLTARAREQPIFGWAGWNRQHVSNEWGWHTVADSLWVIFFGKFGAVGLASLIMTILLPAIIFVVRYPPELWGHPKLAPAAAMAIILVLYMMDGMLNAMENPLFMVSAGAILSAFVHLPKLSTIQAPPPMKPMTSPTPAYE